jgi:hypothetical protein
MHWTGWQLNFLGDFSFHIIFYEYWITEHCLPMLVYLLPILPCQCLAGPFETVLFKVILLLNSWWNQNWNWPKIAKMTSYQKVHLYKSQEVSTKGSGKMCISTGYYKYSMHLSPVYQALFVLPTGTVEYTVQVLYTVLFLLPVLQRIFADSTTSAIASIFADSTTSSDERLVNK